LPVGPWKIFNMSLVFAAVTPHPPVLLPSLGKETAEKLSETKKAFLELEQQLYLAKPQILLTISPHEGLYEDVFVVNAYTDFSATFEQFGDVVTKYNWQGSPDFASKISHSGNMHVFPIRLVSEKALSYGASIPLSLLTGHLENFKVVPVGYSKLGAKEHLEFGELLKDVIMSSNKRVAVIASGDLSHHVNEKSLSGYREDGKKFDSELIQLLQTRNTLGVAQMNPDLVEKAEECGYRSILITLGILKNIDYTFKSLAYEAPFGVGYLTGQFVI